MLTAAVDFAESLDIIPLLCNVSLNSGIMSFLYVESSRNLDILHDAQSPKQNDPRRGEEVTHFLTGRLPDLSSCVIV